MQEPAPTSRLDWLHSRVRALDERKARRWAKLLLLSILAMIVLVPRQEPPPPTPEHPGTPFLDKVGLVSPQFVVDTSRWIHVLQLFDAVIYIDGRPPTDDIQAWTVRTASDWGVGTQRDERGLVLFIFPAIRTVRAEIGYGLEGSLPDARMRQLLEDILVPEFTAGRYESGLEKLLQAIYDGMGGDAAAARMSMLDAARPRNVGLWDLAWKNGGRLLPTVWRTYRESSVYERFVILVFAAVPLFFAFIGLTVLALTVSGIAALPARMRAERERASQQAAEAALVRPAGPPAGKRGHGKSRAAPRPRVTAIGQDQASDAWRQGTGGLWFMILMGLPVCSLCAAVVVFAFALAPDWLTREGRYGGGGVSVTWVSGQRPD